MKKLLLIFAVVMLLFSFETISAGADTPITVYVNGNMVYFDSNPVVYEDCTYVPVRNIMDALGAAFDWNEQAQLVSTSKGTISAWMQVGSNVITVSKNGVVSCKTLPYPLKIIDNRTYVPIRMVSEIFDGEVSWNNALQAVAVTTPDYSGDAFPTESNISMMNFNPPVTVTRGSAFVLDATIYSSVTIDRVNVKITDNSTGKVQINETEFDVNKMSYGLSSIDNRVKFGTLSDGSKTLAITVVDKTEYRHTFTYTIEVTRPTGLSLSSDTRMLWPVPSSNYITTVFWCDNPFCHSNAGRINGHAAIDIAAPNGADVVAAVDGVVNLQGFGDSSNGNSGYGNFISIDSGDGLYTQYSHLSAIYVTTGQQVYAGMVIGAVGSTGNSTGPHLDFKITKNGVRCDPLYYLNLPAGVHTSESCDAPYLNAALAANK